MRVSHLMRAGGIGLVLLGLGCGESKSDPPGAAGAAPVVNGGAGGAGGKGMGAAGTGIGGGSCASIEFADPEVDAAVRAALVGAPPAGPLSPADVAPLVRLGVGGAVDLGGVECLNGLVDLTLYSPAGPSLLPLTPLSLEIIAAYDGSITHTEALGAITTLEQLTLDGVGVVDLTFASRLTSLATISVTRSPLSSLSPLAALSGLQGVLVEGTNVADLGPLAALGALRGVNVSGSQVSELDGMPAPSSDLKFPCFHALDLPLSPHAIATGIPALCDSGWAVTWSTTDGATRGTCNGDCNR